jgi:hypothetical protein
MWLIKLEMRQLRLEIMFMVSPCLIAMRIITKDCWRFVTMRAYSGNQASHKDQAWGWFYRMNERYIVFCTVGTGYVALVDTRLITALLSKQDNRACRLDLEPVMKEWM